jgi:CheY-like chemotaxis protein
LGDTTTRSFRIASYQPTWLKGAVTEKLSLASNAHDSPEAGCPDLNGLRVLLVEDSLSVGEAMKSLLQACGAKVAGPVATTVEADRLISENLPDAALVDVNLRGGEQADGLIDRLHDQGVRVVVTSGYTDLPLVPRNVTATLPKPFTEAQFFAALLAVAAPAADGCGS